MNSLFVLLLIWWYEFIVSWLFLQCWKHWCFSIFRFLTFYVFTYRRITDLRSWGESWLGSRFRVDLGSCNVCLTIIMLIWFLWLYFWHVFDGVCPLITLSSIHLWSLIITFLITCALGVHDGLSYWKVLSLILSS